MATYTGIHIAATGGVYRAFPFSEADFTNWATRKVALTESGATGKYSGSLDDIYGLIWGVFASDTTPASFTQAVAVIDLSSEKVALIGTGSATISAPVTEAGTIERIVRGDDYKSTNNRAFSWTMADPQNIAVLGSATCTFAGRKRDEGVATTNTWSVNGTLAASGDSQITATFELSDTDTASLDLGEYEWSVEIIDDSGNKITPVLTDRQRLTRLVEKFS